VILPRFRVRPQGSALRGRYCYVLFSLSPFSAFRSAFPHFRSALPHFRSALPLRQSAPQFRSLTYHYFDKLLFRTSVPPPFRPRQSYRSPIRVRGYLLSFRCNHVSPDSIGSRCRRLTTTSTRLVTTNHGNYSPPTIPVIITLTLVAIPMVLKPFPLLRNTPTLSVYKSVQPVT
jgi:hypothetical protein